jgi:hypothetical protein
MEWTMCDYSLEGLQQTDAVEGEKYTLDGRMVHGFIVPMKTSRSPIVAACVKKGQRLKLTNVAVHPGYARYLNSEVPKEMVVTVMHRRDDTTKYRSFGPHGDGIILPSSEAMPIAMLWHADMEVLPPAVVKPKKRNLSRLLGLDNDNVKAKTRDLVDGD